METRNWKLENGKWKMETGALGVQFSVSFSRWVGESRHGPRKSRALPSTDFHFLVSIF
jgi:hypothetical protein